MTKITDAQHQANKDYLINKGAEMRGPGVEGEIPHYTKEQMMTAADLAFDVVSPGNMETFVQAETTCVVNGIRVQFAKKNGAYGIFAVSTHQFQSF